MSTTFLSVYRRTSFKLNELKAHCEGELLTKLRNSPKSPVEKIKIEEGVSPGPVKLGDAGKTRSWKKRYDHHSSRSLLGDEDDEDM